MYLLTDSYLLPVKAYSILGPLLFIIYMNDLPDSISHCNIYPFADDTKISLTR